MKTEELARQERTPMVQTNVEQNKKDIGSSLSCSKEVDCIEDVCGIIVYKVSQAVNDILFHIIRNECGVLFYSVRNTTVGGTTDWQHA